jgi:prolyl-tRNA synthetase
MASENPAETPVQGDAAPQTLPDRTQNPADNQGESKNAAKKAAKAAKLAADKANKANKANKGDNAASKSDKQAPKKAPKKKIEGAALIGIDVSKEEDFPNWYQQVLTKGDMLDCSSFTILTDRIPLTLRRLRCVRLFHSEGVCITIRCLLCMR